jgi:RNA polymerase I-specific transcription initiation factor RRN7
VRKKGFPPELEAVCRDLWLLRVRGFPGLGRERDARGDGGGKDGKEREREGGGLAMFSSQVEGRGGEMGGEGEVGEEEAGLGWTRKSVSWAGEVWALPGVVDTLALVYLGCVLRQEPVRIGDVFRWARNGQMPFLAAVGARSWVGGAVRAAADRDGRSTMCPRSGGTGCRAGLTILC